MYLISTPSSVHFLSRHNMVVFSPPQYAHLDPTPQNSDIKKILKNKTQFRIKVALRRSLVYGYHCTPKGEKKGSHTGEFIHNEKKQLRTLD